MASHPTRPILTPQFCFSTVVLRDFLRAARTVDDTITQHLNALVTPARAGFDPTSTAHKTTPAAPLPSLPAGNAPPATACRAFRDAVLFPAWQSREDVIQYCTGVAEAAVKAAETADESSSPSDTSPSTKSGRILTERDDPYLRRRRFSLPDPQADLLAALMRQERGVEQIVRARSWQVLQARCGGLAVDGSGGGGDVSWETALARWQRRA